MFAGPGAARAGDRGVRAAQPGDGGGGHELSGHALASDLIR